MTNGMVVILDDDETMVSCLSRLLASEGYQVRAHLNAGEFFAAGYPPVPACLLLDNILGDGPHGLEVYQEILGRKWFLPTIFLTGVWDVGLVVEAIKSGADSFLVKPHDPTKLLHEVSRAFARAKDNWEQEKRKALTRARWASITPRERQIIELVAAGRLNKEIASILDLAVITVKVNRANAMKKLGAGNPAHMIKLLHEADL